MGYSARYEGEFKFNQDIGSKGIVLLSKYLSNVDLRKGPQDQIEGRPEDLYYISLKFNGLYDGLVWNGSESSAYWSDMATAVAYITTILRTILPTFKMSGTMDAVGEDGERWRIKIDEDGIARDVKLKFVEVEE